MLTTIIPLIFGCYVYTLGESGTSDHFTKTHKATHTHAHTQGLLLRLTLVMHLPASGHHSPHKTLGKAVVILVLSAEGHL